MDSRQVSLTQADGTRLPSNLAPTEHCGTCYQATQAMESDAIRYKKLTANYTAMITIAWIVLWL
ncbi:hypothetical protein [Microcoleus sp. Pol12B5]|uniref:hypothetical protein n=1 Tax=Microcoleus sp. Pol12B5 TaxID=3055396 RepID=UPI002FD2B25A